MSDAGAAVANVLWLARNARAARRFRRALGDPAAVQEAWLLQQLARHAASETGRALGFDGIRSAHEFAQRVPLTDYDTGVRPAIDRIRRGERGILCADRVAHLVPTSGTTGARKLIPFTASLQQGFDAAVSAWLVDLARQRPALVCGPAYWSVSPLAGDDDGPGADGKAGPRDAVPVGFADDAAYLGGAAAWLIRRALAMPASVRFVRDAQAFWRLTLLALLRRSGLRLVSIWHPSFLDCLVETATNDWPALVDAIESGECRWGDALPTDERRVWQSAPDRRRAADLRRAGPHDWPRWWPHLQVVSCWGEQAAEWGWRRLSRRLPHVLVQPKGLLATEAVVTIPLGHERPLAITSHYFEFLDQRGDVHGAQALQRGASYEVIVTNGGGLWRYRLGDVVECTGHVQATPSLRFLGRGGHVSDLRGEKLGEPFVAEVLRALWPAEPRPAFAALEALDSGSEAGYALLVDAHSLTEPPETLGERLESALGRNPHYALARRLGQLRPVRVVLVDDAMAAQGIATQRGGIGEAKPWVLR